MNNLKNQLEMDYDRYVRGIHNFPELLFYMIHGLKDYGLHDIKCKKLLNIIHKSLKHAIWRTDIPVTSANTRYVRFSFLNDYSNGMQFENGAIYEPMDVANEMLNTWPQIYNHPCLYPAMAHLLEASSNISIPDNIEALIQDFISSASKSFEKRQKEEAINAEKIAEAEAAVAAYDLLYRPTIK